MHLGLPLFITVFLTGLFVAFLMQEERINWSHTILFALICFAICFVSSSRFGWNALSTGGSKKIYDDVSLLESSSFSSKPVTTDMKTLTEEIEKFAEGKKIEIDTLKIREEYRKDFLGKCVPRTQNPTFYRSGVYPYPLGWCHERQKTKEKVIWSGPVKGWSG